MRTLFTFILATLLSGNIFAQNKNDVIDTFNVNLPFLESLVKQKIDSVRMNHHLNALMYDTILKKAADHHAKYLSVKTKLEHEETGNKKFAIPMDRVNYYGGSHYMTVGENLVSTYIFRLLRIKKIPPHKSSAYEQAANDIMLGWVNSPLHYENLLNKDYTHTAVAIYFNKKTKNLKTVQVFGG